MRERVSLMAAVDWLPVEKARVMPVVASDGGRSCMFVRPSSIAHSTSTCRGASPDIPGTKRCYTAAFLITELLGLMVWEKSS